MVIASLASLSSGIHVSGSSAPVPLPPTLLNGQFSKDAITSGTRSQLKSSSALSDWTLELFTTNMTTSKVIDSNSNHYWLVFQQATADADFNPGPGPNDGAQTPTYFRLLSMNVGSAGLGNVTRTRLSTTQGLTFAAGSYRLSFQAKRRYASYGNFDLQYWNTGHRLKAAFVGSSTLVSGLVVDVNPSSANSQLTTSWVTFVTGFTINSAGDYKLRFDGDIGGIITADPLQSGILLADVKLLPAAAV